MRTIPATLLSIAAFAFFPARLFAASEPEAIVRVPTVAGEPGQEVSLEFRADLRKPVLLFQIHFDVDEKVAEFLRTDIAGTASAHAAPRGVIFNPSYFEGGYLAGVRFDTQVPYGEIAPGEDLLIVKAVFRIRADANPGSYPIEVLGVAGVIPQAETLKALLGEVGEFRVAPPSDPRPVGSLSCLQEGAEVKLSWSLTEGYDSIAVKRNGTLREVLAGTATGFADRPAPGPASYSVTAFRAGKESLPASCEVLVRIPRPPAPGGFACAPAGGAVDLTWTNGAAYDAIALFRNGRLIADLPGTAGSYSDPFSSEILTVYSLVARSDGIETSPATCMLNETSDVFIQWAEEVRAEPGALGIPVRVFETNPQTSQGLTISFRIDPALARIRELSVDGTAIESIVDQFLYQEYNFEKGETAAGIYIDTIPPFGNLLLPGADRHAMTILVDVLPGVPRGTAIPVELGTFGNPPLACIFTVQGETRFSEVRPGAILVGESPVPEVTGASAEVTAGGAPPASGGEAGLSDPPAVQLRWKNAAQYSAIRIERDGKPLAKIPGGDTAFSDPDPGPGLHRYRILSLQGVRESFPVALTALPRGVPGTFLRGDANSDRRVDIADAVTVISHLFLGGIQPGCLDAADADDSGRINITDAVAIIFYCFRGTGPLPPPGARTPWFDPTLDELTCE